eukprot:6006995-Prymnesium_polylepis.2
MLRHPNVVRLHEVIDDPVKDKLYLILDYVPGGPMMSGARQQAALPEERARALFRDVVCGLAYLHFQGVVHQDLKPEVHRLRARRLTPLPEHDKPASEHEKKRPLNTRSRSLNTTHRPLHTTNGASTHTHTR